MENKNWLQAIGDSMVYTPYELQLKEKLYKTLKEALPDAELTPSMKLIIEGVYTFLQMEYRSLASTLSERLEGEKKQGTPVSTTFAAQTPRYLYDEDIGFNNGLSRAQELLKEVFNKE